MFTVIVFKLRQFVVQFGVAQNEQYSLGKLGIRPINSLKILCGKLDIKIVISCTGPTLRNISILT